MSRFNPGERVKVVMARNDIFPWQNGPTFEAIFQSGPSGPGDTYSVTATDEALRIDLNGNSADFIAIYQPPSVELKSDG